jgi:hypothetical protein
LVNADLSLIEQQWNIKVIPSINQHWALSGEFIFSYPESEDLAQLWAMTITSNASGSRYPMD